MNTHMENKKAFSVFALVGILLFVFASAALAFFFFILYKYVPPLPVKDMAYMDATLPVETRITSLLSSMTLEEKVGQMALVSKDSIVRMGDVTHYGIGAVLSNAGAKPAENTQEGWSTMVSDFTDASKASRLGVPLLYGVDAIHGHGNLPGATIFPHAIGLGATADAELVEKVAKATAEEVAATGVNWSFSPNLDEPKDIRWGRVYEAFSDDPKLVASLGAAYVKGTQSVLKMGSGSSTYPAVLSTPKHFVGAGSMIWDSSSNKKYRIDQGKTPVNEKFLNEAYLPPFAGAIDAGAQSVMVGLNSWGIRKLSASKHLITEVLKGELGFNGFVVSDWYGVYEIPGGKYIAAVSAIDSGIDMVMLPFDYKSFIRNVVFAVRVGNIKESRIDDAVRRILRAKFALGLFDQVNTASSSLQIGSNEHRQLAREAVSRSLVLLKNEEDVLPIRKSVTSIRVAGSAADNVGEQSGAWTVEWQGIDGNWLPGATSILQGIKTRAGTNADVQYEKDGNFSANGQKADIGIAIVGESPYAEGWGDRENPILYKEDLQAILNLQATCEKVIVVIVSGRPLLVSNEVSSWDGLIEAWLPGSEGQGVADALFGDVPFTGKLPVPWPASTQQLPIGQDGATADGSALLFARDFGLTTR